MVPGLPMVVSVNDTQQIAELCAALDLGRISFKNRSNTPDVIQKQIDALRSVLYTDVHYLYLSDPDDLGSFVDCGSAKYGADYMVGHGRTYRLYEIPVEECPCCSPEVED